MGKHGFGQCSCSQNMSPTLLQDLYQDKKFMGKDIWFRIHQSTMGLAWLITLSAGSLVLITHGFQYLHWNVLQE